MMFVRFVPSTLLILMLTACSSAIQVLPSTQTTRPVSEFTFTESPATSTPEPESTSVFAPTTETTSVIGTPILEWEGVPLLPGAIEGWLTSHSYEYSINMSVKEAERFYLENMMADSWTLTGRQTIPPSMSWNPAIVLDFKRNKESFNIILGYNEIDNFMIISLTLVKP